MWSKGNKGQSGGSGGGGGAEGGRQEVPIKVVLVGDQRCGKTSLVQRFVEDTYTDSYVPTGFEKYTTTYNVADCKVSFTAWDTSGSEAYDSVRPLAYQDSNVFLLCFCLADPLSLHNTVYKWYKEIRSQCPAAAIILCGCRADLKLTCPSHLLVTSEQAIAVSRQIGASTYVETSARTAGKACRDAFEVAALAALGKLNKYHQQQQQQQVGRSKSKRDLKAELKGRARSCCVM